MTRRAPQSGSASRPCRAASIRSSRSRRAGSPRPISRKRSTIPGAVLRIAAESFGTTKLEKKSAPIRVKVRVAVAGSKRPSPASVRLISASAERSGPCRSSARGVGTISFAERMNRVSAQAWTETRERRAHGGLTEAKAVTGARGAPLAHQGIEDAQQVKIEGGEIHRAYPLHIDIRFPVLPRPV